MPETKQQNDFWSYSVKFVCGLQDNTEDCKPVAPGYYSTEINIHNYHNQPVVVRKHILPVVYEGEVIGREPEFVGIRADDGITLPPNTATMDDCCRISELLYGPGADPHLTIGFFEIVSNDELAIDAVYTVVGLNQRSPSIDVERVEGRKKF